MPDIVITEFMDSAAVDALSKKFDVLYDPALVDEPSRLAPALANARSVIVRNRTQVNAQLLDHGPKLKVVGRLGVGLDNIDLGECAKRSIEVIPASGANARAVAEYVIGTALILLRGAFAASNQVANGQWPRVALSNGLETNGRVLGLIGFGAIGQLVALLARPLGFQIAVYDPMVGAKSSVFKTHDARCHESIDDLLANADVVSLHIPLTDQTRGLFNQVRIANMKKGAVLINTARGEIVDENAAIAALQSGHLRGVALDVFAQEPVPQGVFEQNIPGLILTPHIAGLTKEANERVSTLIAQRVSEFLEKQT